MNATTVKTVSAMILTAAMAFAGCSVTAGNPKVPTEKAQIAKRYPAGGTTGTLVVLTGRNFGDQPGMIDVGGLRVVPESWEEGRVSFLTPKTDDPACSAISLLTAGGAASNQMPYSIGDRDVWVPLSDVPTARMGHVAVWTGTEMIVWGGGTNTGGRYNPLTDSWVPTTLTGAPAAGMENAYTAVWTGKEMIVWGNSGGELGSPGRRAAGGRYDPVEDRWYPVSLEGAPASGEGHTAVWTGTEMIVWGGANASDGGRYNPKTDTWAPVAHLERGVFAPRKNHSALWTGKHMIVWGGLSYQGNVESTGALYDPERNSWSLLRAAGAPPAREKHAAVWGGGRMYVWGGQAGNGLLRSGASYDPASERWVEMPGDGAPSGRIHFGAAWDGARVVVWGGATDDWRGRDHADGAVYDPSTGTWSPLPSEKAPSARRKFAAVWAGDRLLIWGGGDTWLKGGSKFNTGSALVAGANAWRPLAVVPNEPAAREGALVAWTGREAIVWGGVTLQQSLAQPLDDGARYDPVRDAWLPMSEPEALANSLAVNGVWTGTRLVVWNGKTGAQYNPAADSWQPMSGVPHRQNWLEYSTVWTGKEMVVWGGYNWPGYDMGVSDGTRYDPVLDKWTPTSLVDAPDGRVEHTAVWTGSEMFVYGGGAMGPMALGLGDGGRYDPESDTWQAIPASPFASPAYPKSAWTGEEMLVVGRDGDDLRIGAYKPGANWREIAAPADFVPDYSLSTAWTGRELFVFGGTPLGESWSSMRGAMVNPANNEVRIVGDTCGVHYHPAGQDMLSGGSRRLSQAVWTGDRVFIWGFFGGASFYP